MGKVISIISIGWKIMRKKVHYPNYFVSFGFFSFNFFVVCVLHWDFCGNVCRMKRRKQKKKHAIFERVIVLTNLINQFELNRGIKTIKNEVQTGSEKKAQIPN